MKPYNPKDVNVVVDGVTATGFTEGSVVACERNEDRITPYVGCKGEYAFAVNNNGSGTIKISLQQQSAMNAKMQQLAERVQPFPIEVIDSNDGGFLAGGTEAMVLKEPAAERGKEISEREWSVWVGDYSQRVK